MKRFVEKVKDIVDVRAFSSLHDFAADPAQTLAGYHFTDITANLMATWVDAIANVKRNQGTAAALAGFRGVGKSHFLATLAAIASQPDLRGNITDQHVATTAERLARRRYSVAFVRRGSHDTLREELDSALKGLLGDDGSQVAESLVDLLTRSAKKAGETPLILLIDTTSGRDSRVSRDDGAVLSDIAEIAKRIGFFVGLALDDDIAGADGANSSISRSFSIDYLDQEHLYKIVDSHIFSKKEVTRPLLQEIYKNYAAALPGFRWSEPRFTSLYPLHPATLEIAPLIRLYLQDFALLGFASEAGVRILGRPANSLIGIDEMFDAVEGKLRHVPALADAFVVFDELDREIVSTKTVNLRLPAKLILKGLFMLSLAGQGSTAADLSAAMLIFDEKDNGRESIDVSKLLESFSVAMPDAVTTQSGDYVDTKYCFNLVEKDGLTSFLEEAAKDVSIKEVASILFRQTSEKFSDMAISGDSELNRTVCDIEWRGSVRHGEILWNLGEDQTSASMQPGQELLDWTVFVQFGGNQQDSDPSLAGNSAMYWKLADLKVEEANTLRKYYVLQNNAGLREQFKEKFVAAGHIQSLAVEKIWQRTFLTEAVLVVDGTKYPIADDSTTPHGLSQLFTRILEPIFEAQFPLHPEFWQLLGSKEAAELTAQFFGGAARNNPDVQKLAESFALPLGLVELDGDTYVPVSSEVLADLLVVRSALDGLEFDPETVVTLAEMSSRMRASSLGLSREAQQLVLVALVAQRQFEFVTSSGNRINHRSLDLQIIWDDIAGIAKPTGDAFSSERLRTWAVLITGNSQIKSLGRSEDRLLIIDALTEWLSAWHEDQILEKFEALPDENLNSSIWHVATNLRKTFGAVATSIDELTQNLIPLDQCLHDLADLFSDSESEFEKRKTELAVLHDYCVGAAKRDEIMAYLALCETTSDVEIERLRWELLDYTQTSFNGSKTIRADTEKIWQAFKQKFADHYLEKHNAVMNSKDAGEKLSEILRSDQWAAFESLSDLAMFDDYFAMGARTAIRQIRQLACKSNVEELLAVRPFCACSFSLARFERRHDQATRLETIVKMGLSSFQKVLSNNAKHLLPAVDKLRKNVGGESHDVLLKLLSENTKMDGFPNFSSQELRRLRSALAGVASFDAETAKFKLADSEDFSDLLADELNECETELAELAVIGDTLA